MTTKDSLQPQRSRGDVCRERDGAISVYPTVVRQQINSSSNRIESGYMKVDIKEQSILLRPAKPEFDEGLQFAHYLDQAAEGFFRVMLGRESESIIASAFIDSGHTLSCENSVFLASGRRSIPMPAGVDWLTRPAWGCLGYQIFIHRCRAAG